MSTCSRSTASSNGDSKTSSSSSSDSIYCLMSSTSPASATEAGNSSTQFRFLTLNCYGLVVSIRRRQRVESIVDYILRRQVHIVCLQELFVAEDYLYMRHKLEKCLPFSHWYTNTSLVGSSGLAIFSRWPLRVVHFTPFTLRGNPMKFYHGDYFASKGIAYAKIFIEHGGGTTRRQQQQQQRLTVHVFNSHTHAKYEDNEREDSQYAIYRLTQAYQVTNNVQMVCDRHEGSNRPNNNSLVLLAGDLNLFQYELPYQLIKFKVGLFDCHPCNQFFKCDGILCRTYQHPANTIVGKETGTANDSSKLNKKNVVKAVKGNTCEMANKLDYIFIKLLNTETLCNVQAFNEDGLDSQGHSLSDHQPVLVDIKVSAKVAPKTQTSIANLSNENDEQRRALRTCLEKVEDQLADFSARRRFNATVCISIANVILLASIMSVINFVEVSLWFNIFMAGVHLFILWFISVTIILTNDTELKGINTVLYTIQHDIENNTSE